MLVAAGVWTAYGRVDIYSDWLGRGSPRLVVPSWIFLVQGVLAVTNVLAVILLWRWQRAGFYIIAASTITAVLIALLVFQSGLQSFLPLVGLGILYALLRPKWTLFV